MKNFTRGAAAVAAAALGTAAYGTMIERNNFVLRRFTVPVLPEGAPDLRVLHFSDLHVMPQQRRKQEWIAQLADLEPDLVIDTDRSGGFGAAAEAAGRVRVGLQ